MIKNPVISLREISKCYHIYSQPSDRLKEIFMFGKKQYHRDFWALKDINFDVKHGETVGILGQNGCGKSTLLKIIAGVLTPSFGQVNVSGKVASLLELGAGFKTELTGRENIFMNGNIQGFSRSQMLAKLDSIIEFADIGDYIDSPVKTYSSGMYVRLAFACAINVDPEILIIDEALSVGDELFQRKCFMKFEHFQNQGKTVLFVSHSSQTIKQVCNRAILLNEGKIYGIGDPNDMVNEYSRILYGNKYGVEKKSNHSKKIVQLPPASRKNDKIIDSNQTVNDSTHIFDVPGKEIKQEYRYGTGQAEIVSVRLLDAQGSEIQTIQSSERCNIALQIKFYDDIEKPVYAVTIKNLQGLDVYGTNSYLQGLPFESRSAGEVVEICFDIQVSLLAGDYYISLGCVAFTVEDIIPLDRRYDYLLLKVLSNTKDFGIAELDSSIKVKSCT